MGMTYVIGFNDSLPGEDAWAQVSVNSTTDIYLCNFIGSALKNSYPLAWEKIIEQDGLHFMHFDELDKETFNAVVQAIRSRATGPGLTEMQKVGAEVWMKLIEPLVLIDERYSGQS